MQPLSNQSISKCHLLIRRCLQQRLDHSEFEPLVQTFQKDSSLSPLPLARILLDCRQNFCAPGDPLISLYIQTLLLSACIQLSDLCLVLASAWNKAVRHSLPSGKDVFSHSDLETLAEASALILTSKLILDEAAVARCLEIVSRWLFTVSKWESKPEIRTNDITHASVIDPLGKLLASLCSTSSAVTILTPYQKPIQPGDQGKSYDASMRDTVMQALNSCISFSGISMQLFETLSHVQKHYNLFGVHHDDGELSSERHAMEVRSLQFQMGVAEQQLVPSRIATTTYLKAMLRSGKTIDDNQVFAFLQTRHTGDSAAMFTELVFASFDTLSTRVSESQTNLFQLQCRIFINNKLPVILASITSSSFSPLSSEQLLIDVWPQISPTLFARSLTSLGRSFLHVCALAHLISAETVSGLAGSEQGLLPKGLYSKDDLVAQVEANHSRCHKLIDELVRNDGNAGTISHAVVEIMHKYVQAKDTQSLKDLANGLTRKPDSINTIAMFLRPAYVLGPLCMLLDQWRWDDIHGESQPVYEEFGSVLLLIVAFKVRLRLSTSDAGAQDQQGFTSRYLNGCGAEQETPEMSESANKHVADWINAFYVAEALSDELTSGCSAQEFHLLVPTLLRQSVTAFTQGRLTSDALKTGLEYLLEPFLLPSLVSAFAWISQTAHRSSAATSLMLEVLLKSPGSPETVEIHNTVVSMSTHPLKQCVASMSDVDNGSVLQVLQQRDTFSLYITADAAEVSAWTTSPGGLTGSLQRAIVAQLDQSTGAVPENMIPDVATIVDTLMGIEGPKTVVQTLLDFLLQYASNQNYFPVILDFVATLICIDELVTGSLLREALRLQYNQLVDLLKKNKNVDAEVLVHLYRRVGSYANFLTQPSMGAEQSAFVPLHNIDIANADLDAAPAQPDMDILQNEQPEAQDMDQVLDATAAAMDLERTNTNTLDDMFGLQSDNMAFDNLEDFDIEDMF